MKGKHAFEKDQGAATVRAMRAEGRSGLRGRQLWNAVGLLQDQLTDAIGGETGVGAHEAEVPDLHESRREDMLEEAAEELHDVKTDRSVTHASVLSIIFWDQSAVIVFLLSFLAREFEPQEDMRRIGCLGSRRKGRFSKLRYGMGGSAAIAAYLNNRFERDAPPKSRLRAPQAKR